MPDAEPAAGRFVHLAEYHHHVLQHAGRFHVVIEFPAFATAFTNTAKDADAFMLPNHVVDHLGEQHGLAHARSAKQACLTAAFQGHQHIDDLDACLEDFGLGRSSRQRRRRPMHRAPLDIRQGRSTVDRRCQRHRTSAKESISHRCLQRPTGVLHGHTRARALSGRQRVPARDVHHAAPALR